MILRPQFQLRLRSEGQFAGFKNSAVAAGVSMNEWFLRRIEDGDGRVDESDAGAEDGGSGDGATVPVLRKAKGRAKQLRPVQPMRDKLAGGGDAPSELPQRGPASGATGRCVHGKLNEAYCRAIGGGC